MTEISIWPEMKFVIVILDFILSEEPDVDHIYSWEM